MPAHSQPPAAGEAAHTLPNGHIYNGGHVLDNGTVYTLTLGDSRGWLADEIRTACNSNAAVVAALRNMVIAADNLTDGQIDPKNGLAEREFIEAHEAGRAALATTRQ